MKDPNALKPWERGLVWTALLLFALISWVAIFSAVAAVFAPAHAQIGGVVFSERSSSRPHGYYLIGWNTTGTEIKDGTLVMADTTGATSQPQVAIGKGFKTWTHSTTSGEASRILGVLMGNCPGYSAGRILVIGFHPWVKVDATGIAAMSKMRPSLITATNGAMAAWSAADSTNSNKPRIGVFQRYANEDSLRAYVWVNTLGVMGGAK